MCLWSPALLKGRGIGLRALGLNAGLSLTPGPLLGGAGLPEPSLPSLLYHRLCCLAQSESLLCLFGHFGGAGRGPRV